MTDETLPDPVDTIEDDAPAEVEAVEEEGPLTDEDVVAAIEEASTKPEPEPEPVEEPAEPDAEPEPPNVEDEIKSMGLKERSAERFRELTSENKSYKEIFEQAGIKDVADIPYMAQQAKYAGDMMDDIAAAFEPEQYASVLKYGADCRAAAAGDLEAAQRAFDQALPEIQALAAFLGKDIAGIADPIEAHTDLAEAVENGDITRDYALQIAASRTQQGAVKQTTQKAQQGDAQRQLVTQADQQLQQFDAQMQATPGYMAKRGILDVQMRRVRETTHPSQWVEAAQQILAAIPNMAPPAPVKPTPGPVRPGRMTPQLAPQHDTIEAAIEWASNNP